MHRRLVDLQADAVPEAVGEVLAVARVGDDRAAASTSTSRDRSAPGRRQRASAGRAACRGATSA